MNCPRCGTENPAGASKCARCGISLAVGEEAETFAGIVAVPIGAAGAAPARAPEPQTRSMADAVTAGSWEDVAPGVSANVNFGPRYNVQRILGEGGMGAVYKAYDTELDREVALKLIRPGLAMDPNIAQRFKQELLLASKISHKNILRIHDLGEAAGTKFISMAYVEGHDLYHLLGDVGKLPVDRAIKIAKQLCSALDAAHSEGVVHRDFKPQNILLDKNDQVYVSDFGLAKSLESDTGLSRTGEYLGTPRYMAPEQVEGRGIDHRVDIYALGLVMYEMLTGDLPFHADTTIQLMYKRVHEAPQSPKTLNPDLPEWLVRVVMKCLERDPDKRYQNASDVLTDLQNSMAPVGSKSGTIAFTIRRVEVEMPAAKLGLLIAIAIVVIAGSLMLVPTIRQRILGKPETAAQAPVGKHVAVLPLKVIGDPQALGYIGEGFVESLTARLFQLKDVQVAGPDAIAKLKAGASPADAGKALGANLIVSGNLQGGADRIRLVINLDDVKSGKRLWTQEFSGVTQDLLTLEDDAYAKVVAALSVKPSTEELARTSAHPTENLGAYETYLKAENTFTRSELDRKTIENALGMFEQATKLDPNFALAYTGIANASLRMYRETTDSKWVTNAEGAAKQAERLNDALPEVHSSLGAVYSTTGKTTEAIAELKRTVDLAPNFDEGYRKLGDAYRAAGQKEEALAAYRKAIDINSYYWLNYDALGSALARMGKNEEALDAYQHASSLSPDNPVPYRNMGVVYFQMGKFNESVPMFQKALSIQPHFVTYSNLGTAYFYLKRYPESVEMFKKAVDMNPNEETAVGNLADALRWSGNLPEANATYDKAIGLALKELQVNPRNIDVLGSLALYSAKKGDSAQAASFIRRARAVDPHDVNQVYNQAVVEALAGETAQALQTLRECFEKGYDARQAQDDPELTSLKANPLFSTLIQQYLNKKSR